MGHWAPNDTRLDDLANPTSQLPHLYHLCFLVYLLAIAVLRGSHRLDRWMVREDDSYPIFTLSSPKSP
jgi:hypothetical protein